MKLEEVEIVESPVRERKVMSLPDSSKDNQDEEDENEKEKEKQMQKEKEKEKEREKEKEKEIEKEKEKENDEFSFSKFASLHFQGSSTHSHIQQRLRQPLLYHEDEGDVLASAVLIRIMLPSKVLMINCVLFFVCFYLCFPHPPGLYDSMVDHTEIYGRSSRAEARTCFCHS